MITAAILATFVSAVSYGAEASTLSVVQILWICFIMDTISAFAISTDPRSTNHGQKSRTKTSTVGHGLHVEDDSWTGHLSDQYNSDTLLRWETYIS